MFLNQETSKRRKLRWLLITVVVFCILFYGIALTYIFFEDSYKDKVYPGVRINGLDLSGKTASEVQDLINERVNVIYFDGIYFEYKDKKEKLEPIISSSDGAWSYQIINFDINDTIKNVFSVGRKDNFLINLKNKIKSFLAGSEVYASYEINDEYLKKFLEDSFGEYQSPAKDATLIATSTKEGEINIYIEKEKMGVILDFESAKEKLAQELSLLNSTKITLSTISSYPEIFKKDLLNVEKKAESILSLAPLYIKSENNEWELDKKIIADWLTLNKKENGKIVVGFDQNKIKEYLKKEIASEIDIEPVDARFEMKNGRVVKFQASRDGYQVNIASSTKNIITDFLINKATSSKLVFTSTQSSLNTEETNDLGIKEIIGTGHSNFAGSPANRRHNIKTGANAVWGVIIKPGEEFSLVKNLGKVDASSGYLPELVIKDNKTIPEYGGGLCQIATTLFRAAIQSGLPIIERRNHSYRVSYYEPAGTDAAVYIPHPDVKFLNDTGNNILIQYRILGNDLYFDFWGTKDGRKAEITDPVIYNIVKPGPTKIIETLDLEPGKKKCTEHAHNGADAYFDYKVTYTNGEIKEERFNSHYVPWQEVCLLGVEKLSEENPGEENDEKNEETGEVENLNENPETQTSTSTLE